MTGWFLAFLVGASLAVYVPAGLRARRNSPFSSAQLYKKRLSTIAPRSRGGRWVVVPDAHGGLQARVQARARRRRTRLMVVLVLVAIGTGGWAFSGSSLAVTTHLIADVVAVFYGTLLYETRRRWKEQQRKVRSLARHPLSAPHVAWPEMDKEPVAL